MNYVVQYLKIRPRLVAQVISILSEFGFSEIQYQSILNI